MSGTFRPMKPTEVVSTNLDGIEPGLRIVEKYHKPTERYPDPSIQIIAGIKGQGGKQVGLSDKDPIR